MPRQPRLFVDGACYHVYCRVGRGEPVFGHDSEAEALVNVVADVKRRDGFAVLAWCVMANHYHLAIRCGRVPLWRSMRLIQGRYSKGFNRRHRVYGSLWQGRYKAKLVAGTRHLQQLILYVHLNPVAAGLAKNPGRHRWSGHAELIGRGERALVDRDEALLAFGDSQGGATRTYLQALGATTEESWLGKEPGGLPWWGRRESSDQLSLPPDASRLDALGASTATARRILLVDDYLVAAANALGTSLTAIGVPRSGRALTRQREMLALVGVETFGVRVTELAQRLGKNPGVVSRWANTGGERRSRDLDFRERIEQFTADVRALVNAEAPEGSEFVSGVESAFVD